VGLFNEGFPNRCRHCDPAPCLLACLPGAISRSAERNTVFIDPNRCINCASCAMACPFGVIRYHEDRFAAPGKIVAVKCDNCYERQLAGQLPACVEVCKSGALRFEERSEALKRRTDEVARTVSAGIAQVEMTPGIALLNAIKRKQIELAR
jgi:carbon-monoxide dehydrogenase iron sulfur subunit